MLRSFLTVIIFLFLTNAVAQINKKPTSENSDSLIYKNIKEFASKRKLTYWIYSFLFIDPKYKEKARPTIIKTTDNYNDYKNKVIRNIEIVTINPFQLSKSKQSDTTNFFIHAGNTLHIKTRRLTVKNHLLFKKGDYIDPLILRESERLLRQEDYVREAKITIKSVSADTADVIVIVRDHWSVTGNVSLSTSVNKFKFLEKNFLGLGHQLENNISYNFDTSSDLNLESSYTLLNIKNTFISAKAFYNISSSPENNYRGISFNRTFYSPLTKWAGGIDAVWFNTISAYSLPDNAVITSPIRYIQQDIWLGNSFKIFPGKSDIVRISRLITAGRILNTRYIQRPSFEYDPLFINQNATFYLASIGYSSRSYYKDRFIYKFGDVEDVPEGRILALTGGLDQKEFSTQFYTAIKIAFGNYFDKLGYISSGLEYGSFFQAKENERGVVNWGVSYFSNLRCIGKYNLREFIDFRATYGIKRAPYEKININDLNGLYGFNSPSLTGTKKMILNLQTIIYTPLQLIGFKFGANLFMGFAMLADSDQALLNSKIYQMYGAGILVRNENLIINTFQFTFGIYPNIPDLSGASYKINPINVYNLQFKEFEISEPATIPYN